VVAGRDEATPTGLAIGVFVAVPAAIASLEIGETDPMRAMDDALTGDSVALVNVVVPVVRAAADGDEDERENEELLERLDHPARDLPA